MADQEDQKPDVEKKGEQLTITIKSQTGEETFFKVKPHTKMQVCDRCIMPRQTFLTHKNTLARRGLAARSDLLALPWAFDPLRAENLQGVLRFHLITSSSAAG